MRNKLGCWMCGVCVAAGLALVWIDSGCDEAKGVNGIAVSPAAPTVSVTATNGTSVTVLFTASLNGTLALPLEWSVSNPSLGTIANHSGSNAVYAANGTATGDNIVSVKDQYDNEGFATVHQQ